MLNFAKLLLGFIILLMPLAPVESEAWVATRMRKRAGPNPKGFFVLTYNGWKGDFMSLGGADSRCLSDLQTYPWVGKGEIPLSSSNVKAFLCDSSTCNNLVPNRTYAFAASNDLTAGGATFTADANGAGPADSNNWYTSSRFGTIDNWIFWTNRPAGPDPTRWPLTPDVNHCNNWTANTAGVKATAGNLNFTNAGRWSNGTLEGCNTVASLICIVEPQ